MLLFIIILRHPFEFICLGFGILYFWLPGLVMKICMNAEEKVAENTVLAYNLPVCEMCFPTS